MAEQERCVTCGQAVRVVSSGDGTNSYAPPEQTPESEIRVHVDHRYRAVRLVVPQTDDRPLGIWLDARAAYEIGAALIRAANQLMGGR